MEEINIIDPIDPPKPKPEQQQHQIPTETESNSFVMGGHQPNPNLDPLKSTGSVSSSPKSVSWSPELTRELPRDRYVPATSPTSPTSSSSSSSASVKNTMNTVKDVLGKWGRKVADTSKKTEDFAGNMWQHLKTGPSFADAAIGRIAQGTKVLAEGGYEKIFRQTFDSVAEEQLLNSFACYLSTSAGPVMGILYLSTDKLAFCSDNPLSYKASELEEWSYYKVVIPLHQLKAINSSASKANRAEKYIQIISIDNHEFWFMGFLKYDNAVNVLQEALNNRTLQQSV